MLSPTSTLPQAFLELWALAWFYKNLITLFKEPQSEGSEPNFNNGSIEVDLVAHLLVWDILWKFGFQKKSFGLVEPVMDGVVEALEEKSFDSHSWSAVLCDDSNEFANHVFGWFIWEVELFKFRRIVLELLSSQFVESIFLVVDMLKFDQTNSGNFLIFFVFG